MRPPGLCRSQNYEMRAGADDTQSGRHILKIGIPFQTISVPGEWEERGGMIIPTISRRFTGGVMVKRARAGHSDGSPFPQVRPDSCPFTDQSEALRYLNDLESLREISLQ